MIDCVFTGNMSEAHGGAVYNYSNSRATFTNCIFTNNSAQYGAGMFNLVGCSVTLTDCTFAENEASEDCGGVFNHSNSNSVITNCTFNHNSASKGGGLANAHSNPTVTNCTFSDNHASTCGGGMFNRSGSEPEVANCTFSGNSAGTDGGGIYNANNSNPNLTNCILWCDSPDELVDDGSSSTVTYSEVQAGTGQSWFGTGCIEADPCFVDAAAGDLHIAAATSPCVDAGDNAAPYLPETDLAGNPRVINGNWDSAAVVDIGAYEFPGPTTVLKIDMHPQEAVDAGAAWRFDGETQWRDSDDTLYDMAPGDYDVEFKEAPGWTGPDTLAVRVLAATPTRPAAEYKRVPVFDIGQIPPRDAPHGRNLAFYVYSEDLGPAATLSAEVDHWPQGPLYFDSDSGLFTYEPNDTDDRTPFFVAFTAEIGGADPCSQVVEITPVPDLLPESAIVSRVTQPFPDPCSNNYLFVNEIDLQDPADPNKYIWFNTTRRATRSITIAGKMVVLEAGLQYYNLFDDYHDNADIHDMTIHAETVIIRDPLRLPQTDVTVCARELSFEDDGSIDTTPLGDWLAVHNGVYDQNDGPVDGNDGHPAGDIDLYIGSFSADASGGPRFIMNGGKGQDPEPGCNGGNGTDVDPAPGWSDAPERPAGITYIEEYVLKHTSAGTHEHTNGPYYSPDPPLDIAALTPRAGTDAVPAGKPGSGGAGGDLIAAFDLSAYAESLGGQSGQVANGGITYTGGRNRTPNPAYQAVLHHHKEWSDWGWDYVHWFWCWYGCHYYSKGGTTLIYWAGPTLNGAVPSADVPVGPPGKTFHRPAAFAWLTPYPLKMVVAHAKDAYLYGYAAQAQEILQEYYDLLETYMGLPKWSELSEQWRLEFEQIHDEIGTLLHRLASGLDYFGNLPGWVPMLSFEALRTAYEQEIDHAIGALYLSYWIRNKAQSVAQKQDALKKGRDKLWDQTQRFRSEYKTVAKMIGPLEAEAEKISSKIGRADPGGCYGLLCELKAKEAELVREAEQDVQARYELPEEKKILRTLGTIVGSVSTGGSRGAAGKTLGVAAGIGGGVLDVAMDEFLADPDPWPLINMRTDVVKQFNSIEFDDATTDWLENFDDISDVSQIEDHGAQGYLATMRNDANEMAGGLYGVKETLMTTSLSNEEVEAKLKEIKAKDPNFNRLVDDVTELMIQKELFNRRLASTMQKVSTLSVDITNNIMAIDAMNRQAASISRILDPRAIMYVRDLEKRALARLVKYHYYMLKAYEYRLLEPAPKECDLNVQDMFNKMQQIVSADGRLGQTDYDALKVIYEEQLQAVTDAILEKYTRGEEKENSKIGQTSLWPKDVEKLNRGESVTVNLFERGMFEAQRENLRIIEVNVLDIELEESPSGQCPTAYVTLLVDHCGVSDLQLAGQRYQFTHPGGNIHWDTDCYVNGFISPPETSDAQNSLLSILLGGLDPDKIMFYSRPAAWADLTIVRSLTQVYPCSDVKIKSVILGVKYDYKLRDADLKTVIVAAEPNGPAWGLMPYFVVEKPDENGRQDGTGSFRRIYDCPSLTGVKVTAPEVHGCWEFDKWTWMTASGQTATSTNPTLTVGITCQAPKQQSFGARYNYEGPPLSPADVDQSAYVDFSDYDALTSKWHRISTDPQWDDKYDISDTADGMIDMGDVAVFADNWLTTPQ